MLSAAGERQLAQNVAAIRATAAEACRRSGRAPESVKIVAVTKYAGLGVIRALLALGERELGESRVQQLTARAETLGADPGGWDAKPGERPRWHLIGSLQRNKVKHLLPHTRIVHAVDSPRLAEQLQTHAARAGARFDVFAQVNVSQETVKHGVGPDEALSFLETLAACDDLTLRGLMTMAPLSESPEDARPHFAALRRLLEQARAVGAAPQTCRELSMGMTLDYGVAIEEGATVVRVGSAYLDGLTEADRTSD